MSFRSMHCPCCHCPAIGTNALNRLCKQAADAIGKSSLYFKKPPCEYYASEPSVAIPIIQAITRTRIHDATPRFRCLCCAHRAIYGDDCVYTRPWGTHRKDTEFQPPPQPPEPPPRPAHQGRRRAGAPATTPQRPYLNLSHEVTTLGYCLNLPLRYSLKCIVKVKFGSILIIR